MTDLLKQPTAAAAAPRRRAGWPRWVKNLGWAALVIGTLVLSFHRQWAGFSLVKKPTWQQVMPVGTEVQALAQDEKGNLYLAGTFTDTLRLGPATLVSTGETDVFVACWQPGAGRWRWVKQAGGPGADVAKALVVRGSAVYVAGYVGATVPRRPTVAHFDSLALPAKGITDMFVAKLATHDATEVFEWVQGMRGARYSEVQNLAVNGTAVYLAGICQASSGYLGPLPLRASPFSSPAPDTMSTTLFVARLTDYGGRSQYAWVQPLPGQSADSYLTGLGVADSAVYLVGNFSGPQYSDNSTPASPAVSSAIPPTKACILKYSDKGTRATLGWLRALGDNAGVTVTTLTMQGARIFVAGAFHQQARLGATTLSTPDRAGYVACLLDVPTGCQYVWAAALTSPADQASRYRATALALHDSAVYVAGQYEAYQPGGGSELRRHIALAEQFKELAISDRPGIFVSQVIDTGTEGQVRWQQTTTGDGMAHARALAATAGPVYVAGSFVPRVQFGRFWLSFSTKPSKQVSTGFWAGLGAGKSQNQPVVEVQY